jgi:hypothetical protein
MDLVEQYLDSILKRFIVVSQESPQRKSVDLIPLDVLDGKLRRALENRSAREQVGKCNDHARAKQLPIIRNEYILQVLEIRGQRTGDQLESFRILRDVRERLFHIFLELEVLSIEESNQFLGIN